MKLKNKKFNKEKNKINQHNNKWKQLYRNSKKKDFKKLKKLKKKKNYLNNK